jgi:peptidyl-prolyl cis-trans isomerase C
MKLYRLIAVGATLALAACSKPAATDKPADAAATPARPPLVTVNGKPLSNELYEAYAKAMTQGRPMNEIPAEDREQLKEELVRLELIAQQAEKDGLTRDGEVAARLELTRLNLLQQASAQKYLKEREPTEAELRAEFESQLASTPLVEYHARHILVSSQETAQKIIAQLKSGGDFATLAKRFSSDKSTAQKGGDLGWFPPDAMGNKNFADAIGLLKNGEVGAAPVQTQYGWHVLQLLGSRDRPPPTFEAVQDQVKRIVMTRKFRAYSDEMLKTAKIDPPLPQAPGSAAPATTTPAAATSAPADPAPAQPETAPKAN